MKKLIQQMDDQDLIVHYRVSFRALSEFTKLEDDLINPVRTQLQNLADALEAELLERGFTKEDTADLASDA